MINLYWSNYKPMDKNPFDCSIIYLRFSENKSLLNNLLILLSTEIKYKLYFLPFSCYQDSIGNLQLPRAYKGRLITKQNIGSIILEADNNFLSEKYPKFTSSLYNSATSGIITSLTSQQIQDYYYEPENEKSYNFYFKHLMAYIDIDNDYTFLRIYLKKGLQLSESFYHSISQLDVSISLSN